MMNIMFTDSLSGHIHAKKSKERASWLFFYDSHVCVCVCYSKWFSLKSKLWTHLGIWLWVRFVSYIIKFSFFVNFVSFVKYFTLHAYDFMLGLSIALHNNIFFIALTYVNIITMNWSNVLELKVMEWMDQKYGKNHTDISFIGLCSCYSETVNFVPLTPR